MMTGTERTATELLNNLMQVAAEATNMQEQDAMYIAGWLAGLHSALNLKKVVSA